MVVGLIVIATPTAGEIAATTTADLLSLYRESPNTRFVSHIGIYIANLRQSAVRATKQLGASHLLFIDSDMRFPADTLKQLLARDADIVAANYVQRTMPGWCVARQAGVSVSSVGREGLEVVDSVGCGVMLIRSSVFNAIPEPWFDTPYEPQFMQQLGEDTYFCNKARAHGFRILIDHDLSQSVRHFAHVEWGITKGVGLACTPQM